MTTLMHRITRRAKQRGADAIWLRLLIGSQVAQRTPAAQVRARALAEFNAPLPF